MVAMKVRDKICYYTQPMDEICFETVEKMVIFNTFEVCIAQHIAECCKVSFVSWGHI